MAFHKSSLGSFGANLTADIDGYVPTADTTTWELTYDHGTDRTHDDGGNLTEYGDWWESERFPEIRAKAITATAEAEARVAKVQAAQA